MTAVRFENGKRVIRGWDRVFDALSAEPRRQLVLSLSDRPADEPVSLPETAINPNVPPDPEALRRELYHCHLPMLEDAGYIEWETDPLVARRGSRFDEVAVVLESLQATATEIPDPLVVGCQRLERERQVRSEDPEKNSDGSLTR
ncbi:hypothetical protein [Natronococcus wangiae]|uniref:hypothetical protein n=1 Tax=Natronococcus wangiae TaxID=3068275 RepID=UPI00273F1FE1|nr:hypothetical protein [Natronococcus sp. AD5]